jgi:hypothetical protein
VEVYDVFLSHNGKGEPAVRQIAQSLQDRGLYVWFEEWELAPGRPFQEIIEELIATVLSAAVLVGADGLGPWEIPEMRVCLSRMVQCRLPIVPVLLPGCQDPPELPSFLAGSTWVDLRGGITEDGLDRLHWGITGNRLLGSSPR